MFQERLKWGVAAMAATALLWTTTPRAQTAPQKLPTITLGAGMHNIRAEVASTPEQHQIGLMFRKEMGPNDGMLFIFDRPGQQCFWMKNTLIPLDIIFVRTDGTIVNIAENTVPLSLDPVPSLEPVGAVLELAGGRTAELGIKAGDKVEWVHGSAPAQ